MIASLRSTCALAALLAHRRRPGRSAGGSPWSHEGTAGEQRFFHEGTLSAASASNDGPGANGPDWATARVLTLQGAQAE
jgi:hypothetical protein